MHDSAVPDPDRPKGGTAKKAAKTNAWDRRPWPASGDADRRALYEAVGRALSAWETFEDSFAGLWSALIDAPDALGPIYSYGAVRTFEARNSMVKAAADIYFLKYPTHHYKLKVYKIIGESKNFSPRRNDIAHGVVRPFYITKDHQLWKHHSGSLLYPGYVNSASNKSGLGLPLYAYSAADINFYCEQFELLTYRTQEAGLNLHPVLDSD